jgi:hypothetical protein
MEQEPDNRSTFCAYKAPLRYRDGLVYIYASGLTHRSALFAVFE